MGVQNRSWLQLLAFFAFASLASSLLLAALFAGVTVVVAGRESGHTHTEQPAPASVEQPHLTFSGVITDAHCGARHTDPDQGATGCVRMCVHNGSKYSIVDGDVAYELAGDPIEINRLAGQRVVVTGVLDGDVIKVHQISELLLASTP